MADFARTASLALSAALLLVLPTGASGQAGKSPKSVALCLPPGSTKPVSCGTARAGQTIRLQVATTSLPRGPINLMFTEEVQASQVPRTASLTIAPTISRDGSYEVTVPRQLCTTGRDRMGNFEIQHLMSTFNQAETLSRSLGTLTIAC